jgi:hypothetical protein
MRDLEQAVEASHHALDEIALGNPEPFFELYSGSEHATIANPYGPPGRGFGEIKTTGGRAAAVIETVGPITAPRSGQSVIQAEA